LCLYIAFDALTLLNGYHLNDVYSNPLKHTQLSR